MAIELDRIYQGDALEWLKTLPENSVDACVTDPPAGISFMGKHWDSDKGGRDKWIAWLASVLIEIKRVLKPGGHILVWALPRTSHWTGMAIEDAGFYVRDVVTHHFGTGFPKSHNIGKALDKAPEAQQWEGWGTALKPSTEFWYLARKPLSEKTVAANVLKHGCGGLNIDACRIGEETRTFVGMSKQKPTGPGTFRDDNWEPKDIENTVTGRWPANLALSHHPECKKVGTKRIKGKGSGIASINSPFFTFDKAKEQGQKPKTYPHGYIDSDGLETVEAWDCHPECPVRMMDEQSGVSKSAVAKEMKITHKHGQFVANATTRPGRNQHGDTGGASRFFYCSKASSSERWRWCKKCQIAFAKGGKAAHEAHAYHCESCAIDCSLTELKAHKGHKYHSNFEAHPTQKPESLMRWLCRLVTQPGGVILDPFAGSGTTCIAALQEGFKYLACEQGPEYVAIAEARIAEVKEQKGWETGKIDFGGKR